MATLKNMTRVGADVRQIARLLQAKAPENHMLAYITPEEAELLKSRGGSGMPDPQTGIPTYYVPDPEYVDPYALIHMKYPQQESGFDASASTVPALKAILLLIVIILRDPQIREQALLQVILWAGKVNNKLHLHITQVVHLVRMDSLVLILLFSKKPLPHTTWLTMHLQHTLELNIQQT
jgi:hypothetical protein